ncbi:hypothetical protein HK096_002379, partial [Nowakowskiella sp. JEL0078]
MTEPGVQTRMTQDFAIILHLNKNVKAAYFPSNIHCIDSWMCLTSDGTAILISPVWRASRDCVSSYSGPATILMDIVIIFSIGLVTSEICEGCQAEPQLSIQKDNLVNLPDFPDIPLINCTTKNSVTYIPPHSNFTLNIASLRTLTLESRGVAISAVVMNVRDPEQSNNQVSTAVDNKIEIRVTFRLSDEKYSEQVSVIGREVSQSAFSLLIKSPMGGSMQDTDSDNPCILVLVQITLPRKSGRRLPFIPGLVVNTRLVTGLFAANMTEAAVNFASIRTVLGAGLIAGNDVTATSLVLANGAGGIIGTYSGFRHL